MLTIFKKLFSNQTGGIALMGAAAISMLLVVSGGAIEFSRWTAVNTKFKAAVDSALLAAVSASNRHDDELDEVALKFFRANFPKNYSDVLELDQIDVVKDPNQMAWEATATATMKPRMAAFIGVEDIAIEHKVRVAMDLSKKIEAVFTLDTSASMCMDVQRTPKEDGKYMIEYVPDYRCEKLNGMKEAMHYIIDNGLTAIEGDDGPMVSAGFIPFNHKVRFPNVNNLPLPLTKSEETLAMGDPDYFKTFEDAEPLSPIMPLKGINTDDEREAMKDYIDGIAQSPTGKGWTRSNIATLTSALMLDPAHYSAFGGDTPKDFGTEEADKIVVMMTDGANMGCCYAAHAEGNFENQYLYLYEADNAHLTGLDKAPEMRQWADQYGIPEKGLCEQMKEEGITVYSVLFDVDANDPGGQAMHDVYKSCASNDQFFFDIRDPDDLVKAYKAISDSMRRIRIIY